MIPRPTFTLEEFKKYNKVMQIKLYENITVTINALTAVGGLIGLTIALKTYNNSAKLRRKDITKDIIFPLIQEFDKAEQFQKAKHILDGWWIPLEDQDKKIFGHYYPEDAYTYARLDFTLRDHESTAMKIFTPEEKIIRSAFDSFLDFLAKLDYLRKVDLLSEEEVDYFRYFIDKVVESEAIVNYMRRYKFQLHGYLNKALKL